MEVRASHILVASLDEVANLQKLLAEGAEFGALAAQYSKCPSAQNGGDLGRFSEGMMVKPFQDAAFALAVSDVSEPVQTQFGYHLIKRTA